MNIANKLPEEMKVKLKEMHDIDCTCQAQNDLLAKLIKDIHTASKEKNQRKVQTLKAKVEPLFSKLEKLSRQKIELAEAVYNLVDRKIQLVDSKIEEFDDTVNQVSLTKNENSNFNNTSQMGQLVDIYNSTLDNISDNSQASNLDRSMDIEMPIDENEPVYCTCRQVSFGKMIACDNPDCPIEWFHFQCVGLTKTPKTDWYCPRCRK